MRGGGVGIMGQKYFSIPIRIFAPSYILLPDPTGDSEAANLNFQNFYDKSWLIVCYCVSVETFWLV